MKKKDNKGFTEKTVSGLSEYRFSSVFIAAVLMHRDSERNGYTMPCRRPRCMTVRINAVRFIVAALA
ncbi:MAG: hypothetical protein LUO93_07355, partial [Methanomicrobiales archaeon]|nr:hypothetical protein [Methanomicrobiales archaeon]